MVFVYSSIPSLLFDNPGTFKCFNTLFLLSLYLCFITIFMCDLSVARYVSWKSPNGPKEYQFLPLWKYGRGLGSRKANLSPQ